MTINIIEEAKPYTNDQLLLLIRLFQGSINYGKPMEVEVGDFIITKDKNDVVTVNTQILPAFSFVHNTTFKDYPTDCFFRGFCSHFEAIPLLMHRQDKISKTLINWRLQIGR